jgi:hypothetical protein
MSHVGHPGVQGAPKIRKSSFVASSARGSPPTMRRANPVTAPPCWRYISARADSCHRPTATTKAGSIAPRVFDHCPEFEAEPNSDDPRPFDGLAIPMNQLCVWLVEPSRL